MKKALTITLNKILFYIEEDAYERLHAYLESIKKTFSESAGKDEIIADIEARIAERFTQATSSAKQAITISDVEALIRTMGTSEDLSADQPHEHNHHAHEKTTKPLKKLYRDVDNRILGGVASGVAAYFGVDALYIRLGFVIVTILSSGFGILLYAIMWLIVPEAQSLSQRMEMQGDPVTLKNLEEAVKARVNEIDKEKIKKPAGKIARALNSIFKALGKVVRGFVPAIRVLLGVIFMLAGILGIVAATVGIIGFIINAPDPTFTRHMDPDFLRFIFSIKEQYFGFVMAAVFVIGVVPVSLLFLGGISLLRKKNSVSAPTLAILLSLWMAALITVGITLSYIVPRFEETRNYSHNEYYSRQFRGAQREFQIEFPRNSINF